MNARADSGRPRGPWAAALTPLADREIDHGRLLDHVRWLLDSGCNGVVLFGSTGEAASFTLRERMSALEHLRANDVPGDNVIVGTGCCATADSVTLSAHATALGCAGVLVIPPFFYKPVSDTGVRDAYSRLIDGIASEALRVYLYHFPDLSGVPVSHDVIGALSEAYPNTIAGVKDSTGKLDETLAFINGFPGLDVFTGDDDLLWPVLKAGGAGAVTATANVIPQLLGTIWQAALQDRAEPPPAHDMASRVWQLVLEHYPVTEAFKECLAFWRNDPHWRAVREPLVPLDSRTRQALIHQLSEIGFELRQ